MAKKLKIYLDTSVPNAYFDEKNLLRKEITRRFWKRLEEYEVFISDLVLAEIDDVGDEVKKKGLVTLLGGIKVLSSNEDEIKALAQEYVSKGIIPVKHIEDAIHIAVVGAIHELPLQNSMDVLISWNFEHIVKLKTKREANAINMLLSYNQLELVEPSMI